MIPNHSFPMTKTKILIACLIASWTTALRAEGPGDEVIVIYNSHMPESKAVAEHYAERRHVPKDQLFGFNLTTGDEMSRGEFTDALLTPLAKALIEKKLWHIAATIVRDTNNHPVSVERKVDSSKIRYAVICYGVPFRIYKDLSLKEPGIEAMRTELRRNEAAVDSDLAILLPGNEQHLPLTGPLVNPLYGTTNAAALNPTNGVLIVARLDGPSPAIASGLVDKAIEAETHGLWGRAYVDIRSITDPGYKLGDDWMRNAADTCRRCGFETTLDTNPGTFPPEFPMSQIAFYLGWYDNEVSGPFTRTNVEFMPGAFAYHLHSFSAASVRNPTHHWVGPLLAKGVTATMGCVDEPYLAGTPDLAAFTARFLYYGFSFGEAAYASQNVLSWQTTVIGDPLYNPFKKAAQTRHEELLASHSKLIEWSYARLANINLAKGAPPIQVVSYLEGLDVTRESPVLNEKLGDLYLILGKPSSAIEMWKRATTLSTSRQQRIRLRLELGEKLASLSREAEAAEEFAKILQDDPDYPAKIDIYRKLQALAQKLGKKDVAANYEQRIRELSPGTK
jgi:uncharacterized protein (TIGR03790 family)